MFAIIIFKRRSSVPSTYHEIMQQNILLPLTKASENLSGVSIEKFGVTGSAVFVSALCIRVTGTARQLTQIN